MTRQAVLRDDEDAELRHIPYVDMISKKISPKLITKLLIRKTFITFAA
jgi:hypothetical protein